MERPGLAETSRGVEFHAKPPGEVSEADLLGEASEVHCGPCVEFPVVAGGGVVRKEVRQGKLPVGRLQEPRQGFAQDGPDEALHPGEGFCDDGEGVAGVRDLECGAKPAALGPGG